MNPSAPVILDQGKKTYVKFGMESKILSVKPLIYNNRIVEYHLLITCDHVNYNVLFEECPEPGKPKLWHDEDGIVVRIHPDDVR